MIHLTKRQITLILYIVGFGLYGIVFFLGLNQLAETRRVTANTSMISSNTNRLIKSQTDVLTAIKGVTDSTNLTAKQQTKIIICMLQVPVKQRTTNLQANCRKQATKSDDSTSGTFSSKSSSISKTPPKKSMPKSNKSTKKTPPPVSKNCMIDLLGVHLLCP